MKLHPLSVPYRTAQQIRSVVVFVLLASFLGSSPLSGAPTGPVTVILVGLAALSVVFAWQFAYYRRFEYEITPDTFDIRSGVVSRRNREIPLRRVQNVDVTENVVERLLGIAQVNLETAGGSSSEASLRYVGEDEAERIRSEVRKRKRRLAEGGEATPRSFAAPAPLAPRGGVPALADAEAGVVAGAYDGADGDRDGESLYEISERELLLLSAFSIDFRLVAFAFTLLSFVSPARLDSLEGYSSLFDGTALPAVVFGLFVVVVLWAVGFATTFSRYYGFVLSRIDDTLGYERGLFNRYSGSIPVDKIQTFTLSEGVLKRRFGYSTLSIDTAGYSPTQSRDRGSETAVPLAKRDRILSLTREIDGVEDPVFERPPKRARRRYAFRYALALLALTGGLYAVESLGLAEVPWFLPALALPLAPVGAHLKWRNRGYYLGERYIATRNGFWKRTTVILPYYRVQNLIESSTVLQRRWGIATVTVDTAGTSGFRSDEARAVDVGARDAERIREVARDRLRDSLVERRAMSARR